MSKFINSHLSLNSDTSKTATKFICLNTSFLIFHRFLSHQTASFARMSYIFYRENSSIECFILKCNETGRWTLKVVCLQDYISSCICVCILTLFSWHCTSSKYFRGVSKLFSEKHFFLLLKSFHVSVSINEKECLEQT